MVKLLIMKTTVERWQFTQHKQALELKKSEDTQKGQQTGLQAEVPGIPCVLSKAEEKESLVYTSVFQGLIDYWSQCSTFFD